MSELSVVDLIVKPLKIFCDNTITVFSSKNDEFSSGFKHIEIKYMIVKEKVKKQYMSIENLITTLIIINLFTKALRPKVFKEHILRTRIVSNL